MSLFDFNHRNAMLRVVGDAPASASASDSDPSPSLGRGWGGGLAKLALAGGALVVGAGVLGGGCGGGFSTEAEFCQALAEAQCTNSVVTACYGSSEANIDANTQTCITSRTLKSRCNPAGLPFHPEMASDCIAAQSDAYADGVLTLELVQLVHDACLGVFNRGGVEGTSCTDDTACDVTNGLRCVTHEGGKGTCRLPVLVNPGDPCSAPASQCTAGDFCNATGNCVANPGLKQSCGAGKPCGVGLTCDGATSLCKPQLGGGAACTADDECTGGFCVQATSATMGICADQYKLELTTTRCADFRAPTGIK
jgi:hypothetical protein